MTTKFNVGDNVLIEGVVETIYVETTDNEPIYHVRIKGAGTYEAYGIRVKDNVMRGAAELPASDEYKCPECGYESTHEYRYCPDCGKKLIDDDYRRYPGWDRVENMRGDKE